MHLHTIPHRQQGPELVPAWPVGGTFLIHSITQLAQQQQLQQHEQHRQPLQRQLHGQLRNLEECLLWHGEQTAGPWVLAEVEEQGVTMPLLYPVVQHGPRRLGRGSCLKLLPYHLPHLQHLQ